MIQLSALARPAWPLLVLGAVALAGCTANADHSEGPARSTVPSEGRRVEVAVVTASPATLDLSLSGEVEGVKDANLASALGGYVESVRVEDGDSVQSGQLLVAVDRQLYGAAYAQAEAQRDMAKTEYERLVKMGDGVSDSQRTQSETQVKVAEAQLRQASVRLQRASVVAPFAGVVSQVNVSPGEVAGPGTPVVRIVQLDPVHVVASVSDRDVVALREGQEATVTAAAIGQQLTGRVHRVSPVGSANTRSFEVEVEVANPDRVLLPGMVARVDLQTDMGSAIVVPQDWVLSTAEGHGVYIDDGGVAAWRPVELGQVLRNQVIVQGGLAEGDRVISVGHREVLAGDPLLVAREGRCCTAGGRVDFGEGTQQ